MGAWDAGSFDNDTAADWGGDLVDEGSEEMVRETLATVADTPPDEYLDQDDACEALAAAEVVAAAAGRPGARTAYSEEVLDWAARHQEVGAPDLVDLARSAVDRIDAPQSELRDLWLEDDDGDPASNDWVKAVAELRSRLPG